MLPLQRKKKKQCDVFLAMLLSVAHKFQAVSRNDTPSAVFHMAVSLVCGHLHGMDGTHDTRHCFCDGDDDDDRDHDGYASPFSVSAGELWSSRLRVAFSDRIQRTIGSACIPRKHLFGGAATLLVRAILRWIVVGILAGSAPATNLCFVDSALVRVALDDTHQRMRGDD